MRLYVCIWYLLILKNVFHYKYRIVEAGAKHYFTVPGDFTLALLDEFLKEENLTMIGCCNELNAGYAADGYCRATKGLGVAMGI